MPKHTEMDRSGEVHGRARSLRVTMMALVALLIGTLYGALYAPSAEASALVARNVNRDSVRLKVANGVALVQYRKDGTQKNVLAWGATNTDKVFKFDYSGGWASGKANWKTFTNRCGPYTGPGVPFALRYCTAGDGTHWVLHYWQRIKPNFGGTSGDWELRLAHFSGRSTPKLEFTLDWIPTRWHTGGDWWDQQGDWELAHLQGKYTYRGKAVVGDNWLPNGYVTDLVARNVAVEARDTDHGNGWRRVNMFLAKKPYGQFCFIFGKKGTWGGREFTGRSKHEEYRMMSAGPGVTSDALTYVTGPGDYDPLDPLLAQKEADAETQRLAWRAAGAENCEA